MRKLHAFLGLPVLFLITGCSTSPYLHLYSMVDLNASNEDLITVINQPGFDANAEQGKNWVPPLCALADLDERNEVIEHLISKGASVNNCYNNRARTYPLHQAAEGNAPNNIRSLLAHGANLHLVDYKQRTPLAVAIEERNQEAITVLRQAQQAESAWQQAQKENTVEAYKQFLHDYPFSHFREEAGLKLSATDAQERARQQETKRMEALEASLPAQVRKDKYLIALSQYLKQGNYADALPLFEKLEALPTEQDPSLNFFHGEALLRTGQPTPALQKLYRYVNTQGRNAPHYRKALGLINEAESKL